MDWSDPKIAEQIPINQAIAEGLIDFIPETWKSAELQLEFDAAGGGVGQRVVCPDTGAGWTVSHELMEAALHLDEHRRKFGLPWRSAVYGVRLGETGQWQVSASFK